MRGSATDFKTSFVTLLNFLLDCESPLFMSPLNVIHSVKTRYVGNCTW
jgi:hypothetical protein